MSFKQPGFDPSGSGSIVYRRDNYQVPSLLLGVGYRQPIAEHASFIIMGFYDVLYHENSYSPYGNHINFQMGFNLGY
jgi:hypothetical protein